MVETKTAEQLAAERLAYLKQGALDDIKGAARELYARLGSIKKDVDSSLERMQAGNLPYGGSHGPLGNQAPVDVVIYSERLERHIQNARIAGASVEDVQEAFNSGIAGLI